MLQDSSLHLISRWFIKPGNEAEALVALDQLAAEVECNEPDTLVYCIHTPLPDTGNLVSLPPVDPLSILFFEVYRDIAAFIKHVNGPVFSGFVRDYGELFVDSKGQPFTFVEFMSLHAGFFRQAVVASASTPEVMENNRHPAVMFEFIANNQQKLKQFYQDVFGWQYQSGTGGFAYVHFGVQTLPLLGGIGQASSAPGFEPGHSFYLRVDNLNDTIGKAVAAGGSRFVCPTEIDGYRFAMVKDPEGNAVGLIEPFC